jgi:hypothetical protein
MKTEMQMLPNGNYESVICPIQHRCFSKNGSWECIHYACDKDNLYLEIEEGDPYEIDGFSAKITVNFCPFCGYSIIKKHE